MLVTRRLWGLLTVLLVGIGCFLAYGERSYGQGAAMPSSDELQLFQGLSPEQRDAVLKAMSGGGDALGAAEIGRAHV